MTKFQSAIVVTTLAAAGLIPRSPATAQTTPSTAAPAAQQNTIASGSTTLPKGDAAVQCAAKEMAEAAMNFWVALTPELQAKCTFPFDSDERFNWHFIPRERKGITWNDMTPAQQALRMLFLPADCRAAAISRPNRS